MEQEQGSEIEDVLQANNGVECATLDANRIEEVDEKLEDQSNLEESKQGYRSTSDNQRGQKHDHGTNHRKPSENCDFENSGTNQTVTREKQRENDDPSDEIPDFKCKQSQSRKSRRENSKKKRKEEGQKLPSASRSKKVASTDRIKTMGNVVTLSEIKENDDSEDCKGKSKKNLSKFTLSQRVDLAKIMSLQTHSNQLANLNSIGQSSQSALNS
mmetsp:Transcript_13762/g.23472  ORF Transcript_13762/g.23472 Transcript_13762/m.23472 type:complete len:214 (-) Transcript_13762:1050-1691(-)